MIKKKFKMLNYPKTHNNTEENCAAKYEKLENLKAALLQR